MRGLIVLVAVTGLVLGVYVGLRRFGHLSAPTAATPALPAVPDLALTDLNGTQFHTSNYKNKVVLVNFWAAWCKPCADEIPQFIALQKKYQDQGLQIIGFSVDDDAQELHSFYNKYQVNYPVVPSDLRIADAFGGVLGLPTTFLIGRDRRIHGKHNGATDFAALEREVVALLKSQS
jgi:thiol-disulfide isomerase/thioredoxin